MHDNNAARSALEFVETVDLPPPPRLESTGDTTEAVAQFDFDKSRNQALVVGSDVISFVRGVTEERRNDIVNSTLLAQLVAKEKVGDASRIFPWYEAYFDTLSNIGWVIQDRQFVQHKEKSKNLDAHKAILTVATTLLGPATTALQVVKATLDALKAASEDSPFITLLNRESQHAKTTRFQIGLAEDDANGRFIVSLMAFALSANADLTQVLLFRFRSNEVSLKHASGKITINTEVLASVREPLKRKLLDFTSDFIRKLPDLKA
jgi:hypothetical protein